MPESRIKHNRAIPSNLCFARSEIMFSTVADDGGQGERKKKKGRKSPNSFNNRFFGDFELSEPFSSDGLSESYLALVIYHISCHFLITL